MVVVVVIGVTVVEAEVVVAVVKDPGMVLDIASQIQANGYDIERSEISRIETRSDCLVSCVSQVQRCCAALSC